jgi:hypothetical protein
MSQLSERTGRRVERPEPDEVALEPLPRTGRAATVLRVLGALAVLVVGAVHLEQYFAVHFEVVPVIGPLFALNFAGATLIALGLLLPLGRLHVLLALRASVWRRARSCSCSSASTSRCSASRTTATGRQSSSPWLPKQPLFFF